MNKVEMNVVLIDLLEMFKPSTTIADLIKMAHNKDIDLAQIMLYQMEKYDYKMK